MFETEFDTLAAAVAAHGNDGIYGEVGDVCNDLGMELVDESGGYDITVEYSIEKRGRRLVLGYVLVPVDEGAPVDQRYHLSVMCDDDVLRQRRWRSVDGAILESN